MLVKLGQLGYAVRDAPSGYGSEKVESDSNPDTDGDRIPGHTH
jgi:hypothetical protein